MGEYATRLIDQERVKIGTCEDMYYLRADQIHSVAGGDANGLERLAADGLVRFRFPFPDEDGVAPGEFRDHGRSVALRGLTVPESLADEHYSVQMTSGNGYLTSIPCPESGKVPEGLTIHRNGFGGAVRLSQQKFVGGELVPVLECGGCGMKWRAEDDQDRAAVINALIDQAAHNVWQSSISPGKPDPNAGRYWLDIAERI